MFGRKQGGHYSVRKSENYPGVWKIVIAYTDGSNYDDIGGVEFFKTFEEANERANQMNLSRQGSL